MKLILTGLVLLTALACLDAVPASQLRKLNAKSTNGGGEDGRVYMTKYRKMREKQIGDELNSRAQTERATGRAIQDNRSLNIKQKKKPIAIVNKKSTSSGSGGVKKLSAQMPSNMHQQQQQQSSSFMNMPNQFQQQPQQFGSFQQSNGFNERLSTLSGASHPTAAHMNPFMQQMGGHPNQMQQMNQAGMDPFAMHQMLQQQTQMGGMSQMAPGGAPQGAKAVGSKSALQGRAKLSKNKNAGNNALREQRFKMAMDQDFLAKNPNVYKFIVATYGPEFQEQMMKSQMEKMIEMHQEQMQAKQAAEQRKKEQAAARRQQQQQQQQQPRAQPSRVVTTHVDYDDDHIIDQSVYNRRPSTNNNRNRVSEFDHQEETQRNVNRPRSRTPDVPKVEEAPRVRTSSRPTVSPAQPIKPQQVEKETPRPQNVQPVQQRRPEASHISDEDLIHSEGIHEDVNVHEVDGHQEVDDHHLHHEIDEHHEQDQDQSSQRTRGRATPSNTRRAGAGSNRI